MTLAKAAVTKRAEVSMRFAQTDEVLTPKHLDSLKRFVHRRVKGPADAEDIIQDTLVLACRHMGKFRFESSAGTWLRSIALNVIRGRWRRLQSKCLTFVDPATLDLLSWPRADVSTVPKLERRQADKQLYLAIAQLPPKYRLVLELVSLGDLSIKEAAERLGTTVPVIKSRHHRAKIMLFKQLDDERHSHTDSGGSSAASRGQRTNPAAPWTLVINSQLPVVSASVAS